MPYTTGFGRLERGVLSNDQLPNDLRLAIIRFKHAIQSGQELRKFFNLENRLPRAAAGQAYYENHVGQATATTEEFPTLDGSRRIVALLDPTKRILKMYFTDDHYRKGSWWELQYP
jgi:guanyl-specific ribonuclease Sa